jgi:hypothetical protein
MPPAVPGGFNIRVEVMTDPHATVATATLTTLENPYTTLMTVTGSSKRDNPDEYDAEIGTTLAVSRAVIKLGRQLGRQADGAVRHAESIRTDKAEAKRKRELQARLDADARAGTGPFTQVPHAGAAELPRGGAISVYLAKHASDGDTLGFVLADDIPAELRDRLRETFPGAVLMSQETAGRIDSFLDHPETGTRRVRPARGKHAKPE